MKTIYESPIPINRQAAMVIAKAPWWAMPLPEKKKVILHSIEKIKSIEELVDVTKAPPYGVEDRRGQTYGDLTIIGYADTHESRFRGKQSASTKKPSWWCGEYDPKMFTKGGMRRKRYWWCCCGDGRIVRFKWETIKTNQQDGIDNGE